MEKSEIKKETLIERSKQFFKNDSVQIMYGRSNGHFYYRKPPNFADGHKTFTITREMAGGKAKVKGGDEIEYPFNMKETIAKITECENMEGVEALIESGVLLKDDARKGVIKILEKFQK